MLSALAKGPLCVEAVTLPGVHSLHSGDVSPSTRRCAARRKGRLGVSTPSRRPPFTSLSPSRSQVRGTAFGLLGGTGRIASITAQVVNGALITNTPLLFTVTGAFMAAGCLGALTLRPSGQRGVGCFPLQEHHAES